MIQHLILSVWLDLLSVGLVQKLVDEIDIVIGAYCETVRLFVTF
jgi:hypothetical protein